TQGEAESRPLIHLALAPDLASMPLNHSLHRSKPNASATKLALIVQALERAEQLVRSRHVESRAVIAPEIGAGAVRLRQRSKFYPGPGQLGRELPRVAE